MWQACKERVAEIADPVPNTVVADFMLPSPITRGDDNYWDALHYRVAIADRLARDLAESRNAERKSDSDDYRLLFPSAVSAGR